MNPWAVLKGAKGWFLWTRQVAQDARTLTPTPTSPWDSPGFLGLGHVLYTLPGQLLTPRTEPGSDSSGTADAAGLSGESAHHHYRVCPQSPSAQVTHLRVTRAWHTARAWAEVEEPSGHLCPPKALATPT